MRQPPWFQNVELLVVDDVGRETVLYVANIYKYDVAYRLLVGEADGEDRK